MAQEASPSVSPTTTPTVTPTPTSDATATPTATPTIAPTRTPTARPSQTPTVRPSATPKATATSIATQSPIRETTPTPESVELTKDERNARLPILALVFIVGGLLIVGFTGWTVLRNNSDETSDS